MSAPLSARRARLRREQAATRAAVLLRFEIEARRKWLAETRRFLAEGEAEYAALLDSAVVAPELREDVLETLRRPALFAHRFGLSVLRALGDDETGDRREVAKRWCAVGHPGTERDSFSFLAWFEMRAYGVRVRAIRDVAWSPVRRTGIAEVPAETGMAQERRLARVDTAGIGCLGEFYLGGSSEFGECPPLPVPYGRGVGWPTFSERREVVASDFARIAGTGVLRSAKALGVISEMRDEMRAVQAVLRVSKSFLGES